MVVSYLCREIVSPRLDVKLRGIEWRIGAIVRMQMILARRGRLRIERTPAQQQGRSALRGSDKKVSSSNAAHAVFKNNRRAALENYVEIGGEAPVAIAEE